MEDFYYAGGLRALLARPRGPPRTSKRERSTAGPSARTSRGAQVYNDDVIRPRRTAGPRRRPGGAARQSRPRRRGDQATPRRAALLHAHAGTAVVFDDYNDMAARIDDPEPRGRRGLGAGAAATPGRSAAGHARVGHAADPEEAAEAGRARHGAHLGRAHERHQLRRVRAARGAGVLRRRAAGARARRRRDRARRPGRGS